MFTATLLFFVIHLLNHCQTKMTNIDDLGWPVWPIRYMDDESNADLFFDRIVSLSLNIPNFRGWDRRYRNVGIGVLIDNQRVLTSYNPFREISRMKNYTSKIVACFITHRRNYEQKSIYRAEVYNITCGRQVAYLPEDEIPQNQWHGWDRKHSPVHDLMVLRIDSKVEDFNNLKPHEYTLEKQFPPGLANATLVKAGPFLTELAKSSDKLQKKIVFASIGFSSSWHIKHYRVVRKKVYDEKDDVIVDCDDWLPREWGHFICILNKDNFPGLGSGATLMSNYKLYGVGSFVIFKGEKSVLVFTDVRKYNELIMNTCTTSDTQ